MCYFPQTNLSVSENIFIVTVHAIKVEFHGNVKRLATLIKKEVMTLLKIISLISMSWKHQEIERSN